MISTKAYDRLRELLDQSEFYRENRANANSAISKLQMIDGVDNVTSAKVVIAVINTTLKQDIDRELDRIDTELQAWESLHVRKP
jgi:uncharacterized coiled-coil DUF342 family protein